MLHALGVRSPERFAPWLSDPSRYAPIKIPWGIKRYVEETARLYSVLEDGLSAGKGEWLVGDKYSIVDINIYPWIKSAAWAGVDISKFPKLEAWTKRIGQREAVQKGLKVPSERQDISDDEKSKAYKDAAHWIAKAEEELKSLKEKKA